MRKVVDHHLEGYIYMWGLSIRNKYRSQQTGVKDVGS